MELPGMCEEKQWGSREGGEMIGRSRKEVYGGVGVGADKGAE